MRSLYAHETVRQVGNNPPPLIPDRTGMEVGRFVERIHADVA
jgi:hypothetical protein